MWRNADGRTAQGGAGSNRLVPDAQRRRRLARRHLAGALLMLPLAGTMDAALPAEESQAAAAGRAVAHDVYKGNCLACHQVPGDPLAVSLANIGPPIVQMQERFPDRAALRAQLWDSTVRNPQTVMPPFGKHRVLTEEEIDQVIEYIYQY